MIVRLRINFISFCLNSEGQYQQWIQRDLSLFLPNNSVVVFCGYNCGGVSGICLCVLCCSIACGGVNERKD